MTTTAQLQTQFEEYLKENEKFSAGNSAAGTQHVPNQPPIAYIA
jgi:hypothetical protein